MEKSANDNKKQKKKVNVFYKDTKIKKPAPLQVNVKKIKNKRTREEFEKTTDKEH